MIKYAVIYNYNRTGKLKSDGTASVLIRAYLDKKNKFFNTGVYINPNQWDNKYHRVINHPKQARLNSTIKDQLEAMETFEYEVLARNDRISLDRLADYLKDTFSITFSEFYEQQLEQSTLKKQTIINQRQTYNKLKAFRKRIFFCGLDFKLIKDFNKFLFDQGLCLNSIARHHKVLKKYINLAIKYDYLDINKNPYRQFKIKKEVTERIYLTEHELKKMLEQLYIPPGKEKHRQIRDFFLFCCYTATRFSDAVKLNVSNFNKTEEGIELYYIAEKSL